MFFFVVFNTHLSWYMGRHFMWWNRCTAVPLTPETSLFIFISNAVKFLCSDSCWQWYKIDVVYLYYRAWERPTCAHLTVSASMRIKNEYKVMWSVSAQCLQTWNALAELSCSLYCSTFTYTVVCMKFTAPWADILTALTGTALSTPVSHLYALC